MYSASFRRTFLRLLKFHKLKSRELISWGEPTLQSGWINCFSLLYFNFKRFEDRISSSYIILKKHSVWFRSTVFRLLKSPQIKEGDLISLGKPILQNGWIIWSPLLYFNFESFKDPNFVSFIRFQCLLNDPEVDLISWGWKTNCPEWLNYLVPLFLFHF